MDRIHKLLSCAVLCVPLAATAADGPMGSVGAFVTQTEFDAGGSESMDGIGFGVKGWLGFGVPFAHFEYAQTTVEAGEGPFEFEADIEQLRLGGGAGFKISDPVMLIGKAEYIDFGSDADEDGFGVHAGAIFLPGPAMRVLGTVGYLSLNEADGPELNVAATFNFTKMFGAFVEYRTFMGSRDTVPGAGSNADDDFELNDARVGVMYSWGM